MATGQGEPAGSADRKISDPLRLEGAAVARALCLHCRTPLSEEGWDGYCCGGCKAAHRWITSQGMEDYYRLRDRWDEGRWEPVDGSLAEESYAELDAPGFWKEHVEGVQGGWMEVTLRLHGLHCAACVWLLERLPQWVPGVIASRVQMSRRTIQLVFDPQATSLSQVGRQIAKAGYRVSPLGSAQEERLQRQEQRQEWMRIGIAFACSGNAMMLAAALYAGSWYGMASEHLQLMRWASCVVGLVALLVPGAVFFRGAWQAIVHRTPHMDLPVALGLGAGAISGLWNTLRGEGELYYDSLSMLVLLLLVGRMIQGRQQRAAVRAVDLLHQVMPRSTKRIRDGLVEAVAVESLQPGDTIEVDPGRTIPVDGRVVQGSSAIDTAVLTGESTPKPVVPGDGVTAGSLNLHTTVRIEALSVGEQTRMGQLVRSIEQAMRHRAPILQWADAASGWFVQIVLAWAIVVGAIWWQVDRSVWVERVVTVLIVACPCALGLATPLAVAVGMGSAARRGIWIRGSNTFQLLTEPRWLFLDKTGTLTEGQMRLQRWQGSPTWLAAAAALEGTSLHPVAMSIVQGWKERSGGETVPLATECRSHPGQGVEGVIEGRKLRVGSWRWVDPMVADRLSLVPWKELESRWLAEGLSPVWVVSGGAVVAMGGVADALRPEACQAVARWKAQGLRVGLLSGDHPEIVRQTAKLAGIDPESTWGGATPEEKLRVIQERRSAGQRVWMVGDGVNDGAALAAADVGIAMRGGAEISLQAAGVYLASGSLDGIDQARDLAGRTMTSIRRNAIASLSYNLFSISLASLGWLHPLTAALLMPLSSITVILVTLLGHWPSRPWQQWPGAIATSHGRPEGGWGGGE
ncbi:MAG: heavy metal translocating P-type ATPase [Pirellulaceae bacterium]